MRRVVVGRGLEARLDPSGSASGLTMYARRATSAMAIERNGEPFTETCPPPTTRSSRGASRSAAAMPTIFAHPARGEHRGAPAHHGPAAREGAAAVGRQRGVPRLHGDVGDVDPQLVGDELGQRGLDPLSHRGDARVGARLAARVHAERDGVEAGHPHDAAQGERLRVRRGELGVDGDAEAEEAALGPRARLLGAEALVARGGEPGGQALLKARALVRDAEDVAVREARARDEVPPPHLGRVEPRALGEEVHHPLHRERRRHHGHPAVGAAGDLVGDDAARLVRVGGDR